MFEGLGLFRREGSEFRVPLQKASAKLNLWEATVNPKLLDPRAGGPLKFVNPKP